jgi:hypothetical protein
MGQVQDFCIAFFGGYVKKLIFLVPVLLLIGCASTRVTKFEQYSLAMDLKVAADSSVVIGGDDSFNGVLWLNPIIEAENIRVDKIKLIRNYGNYLVCGENFKRVWMIEPKSDGLTGKYKAIDATPSEKMDVYTGVALSRYGSGKNVIVKFGFNQQQVFIDKKGKVHEKLN